MQNFTRWLNVFSSKLQKLALLVPIFTVSLVSGISADIQILSLKTHISNFSTSDGGLSIRTLAVPIFGSSVATGDIGVAVEEYSVIVNSSAVPGVTGLPLNYPNPFRFNEGTRLGYRLTKAMTVTLKIFDSRGYMVLEKEFGDAEVGGQANYNLVSISPDMYNTQQIAAGIYFYFLMNDGRVLGRGKMAVLP